MSFLMHPLAFAPLYKLKLKTGSRRASIFKSPWSEVSGLWDCQTKCNNSYQLMPYIKYVKIRVLMSTIFFPVVKIWVNLTVNRVIYSHSIWALLLWQYVSYLVQMTYTEIFILSNINSFLLSSPFSSLGMQA